MAGILVCFGLIDAGQFAVRDGDAAVDHGVIHRGAQADRAEDIFGIIARADELEPAAVDQKQVAAPAHAETADVIAAKQPRAAARQPMSSRPSREAEPRVASFSTS